MKIYFVFLLTFASAFSSFAVSKNTAYPSGSLTATELAEQVYFVNHFYSFDYYGIGKERRSKKMTSLILREKGSRPSIVTLERYIHNLNKTKDGKDSQDLYIFRSGDMKGTVVLITNFKDVKKTYYELFEPLIRKVLKFNNITKDEEWADSAFTVGDISFREVDDEDHKLLEDFTFSGCMQSMNLPAKGRTKHIDTTKDCSADGKSVYQLKSTAKTQDWWYEYRISFIDKETFVDYRIDYFKKGIKIKTIDKSWKSANLDDKRGNYWNYWYAIYHTDGYESFISVPKKVTKVNFRYKNKNLWSSETLRRIPKNIR